MTTEVAAPINIAQLFAEKASVVNGKATVDKTFAAGTIPEHLTEQQIADVMAYRDTFIRGITEGVSELGLEEAKKDSTFNQISTSVPFFGDKVDVSVVRARTYPNPAKPEEPITKHGVLDVRYIAKGSLHKQGELKSSAAKISEAWAALAK